MRDMLAAIMGIEKQTLHVITEDVGGAFGLKSGAYPEYPALLAAAKKLGRKVHWMSSRSEAFNSDNQARDNVTVGELALDEDGKFLALRARQVQNLGAYVASAGIQLATNNFARCFPAMYDIPKLDIARAMRLHQHAADRSLSRRRTAGSQLRDRAAGRGSRARHRHRRASTIRKRNLIPASAMPYKTAIGAIFDSGEFPEIFDKALALADLEGFEQRKRNSKAERQAARARHFLLPRTFRRRAERGRLPHLSRQGHAGGQSGVRQHRPGPCHRLPAARRRQARHRSSRM